MSNKNETTTPQGALQDSLENAFGVAAYLASHSQSHKFLFIQDFEWLITPAINLAQFRIFRQEKNQAPLAFISWANINEDIEKRILDGNRKLAPNEWNIGDKAYLIDIISPYLNQQQVLEQLANTDFAEKDLYLTRTNPKDQSLESVKLQDLIKEINKQKETKPAA